MYSSRYTLTLVVLALLASAAQACLDFGANLDTGANINRDMCGTLFLSSVSIDTDEFIEGTTRNVTVTVDNATGIEYMWIRYDSTDSQLFTGGSIGDNLLEWSTWGIPAGTYTIIGCANDSLTTLNCTTTGVEIEVYTNLNRTQTSYFNTLLAGRPFHAARDVYTAIMGGLFWGFIVAVIFFAFWLRTQNLSYATLVLVLLLGVLNVQNYIHPDLQLPIYGVLVAAMGLAVLRLIMSDE